MRSILQIEASRINGAKSHGPTTPEGKLASSANSAGSTGPVTPEGKARVGQNAITHGLLSDSIVLDRESAERFSEILALLYEELQPEGPVEEKCVRVMAVSDWRQMRLWCLEKVQLARETRKQERAFPADDPDGGVDEPAIHTALAFRALTDETHTLENLNRYEARNDRQYQRALACYRKHRDDKRNQRILAQANMRSLPESQQTNAQNTPALGSQHRVPEPQNGATEPKHSEITKQSEPELC